MIEDWQRDQFWRELDRKPTIPEDILAAARQVLDRPPRKPGERGFQYVCYCATCVQIRRLTE